MTLSVVIPTVARQDILPDFITQIQHQSEPAEMIVLVDQSEKKDETLATRTDVTYIYHATPNTPTARNIGVQVSDTDLVLFFDDDIEIHDTHLLKRIRQFFVANEEYAGLALNITDKNSALNRENQGWNKNVMQVTKAGRVLPFANGPEQDVAAPRGGGVAYRVSAVRLVGGFDARYQGNAMREETDCSLRILKQVGPIRYKPDLHIIHLALPRGGSRFCARHQWYRDFFANELLFQLTHFSFIFLPQFFIRKLRPILACMLWYGKGRPSWLLTPLKGFYDGYKRYTKGFLPYKFDT